MTATTADRSAGSALETRKRRLAGTDVIGVAALVIVYLCLAFVLPISTEAPIVDEPIYATSAFEWARTGAIEISGLSAPNAVFDTIWGGVFARVFGETYQALRLSTLVLTAVSAPFMYWLCRNLGAGTRMSLLGTAAYLFSPMVIALSSTFMTDAHFLSLSVAALACFTHTHRGGARTITSLLAGSTLASLAYLSRPQALVIPLVAVLILAFGRRGTARNLVHLAAVFVVPLLVVLGHTIWSANVGEPFIRELSGRLLVTRTAHEITPFSAKLLLMSAIYPGLFALPFLPTLVSKETWGEVRRSTLTLAIGASLAALAVAMIATAYDPTYRQSWLTATGLGAVDRAHLGQRPTLWPVWVQISLGMVAVFTTFAWTKASLDDRTPATRLARSYVLIVGALLLGGVLPASMTIHGDILDRYWLPLIPIILALAAASAKVSTRRFGWSVGLVALIGFFGVAGTYDSLNAYDQIIRYSGDWIEDLGLSEHEFDGGAAWSAQTFGVADDKPQHIFERSGPFWVVFYAVDTKPRYGVALEPLNGYEVLARREFSSILHRKPTFLYLVKRSVDPYFINDEDY